MTKKQSDKPASPSPVILWFRADLRLHDHAGVLAALGQNSAILPVYIWDESLSTRPLGAASRWWLCRSLQVLDEELRAVGSRLIIERGTSQVILASLAKEYAVKTIICSQTFDLAAEETDDTLESELAELEINLCRFNTSLLSPPGNVTTRDGKPFRVFTPFHKALRVSGADNVDALPVQPAGDWPAPDHWPKSLKIDDLKLEPAPTPSGKNWAAGFDRFTPGERGARGALRRFLKAHLEDYASGRDRPDLDLTSHLSPHLRFGEISPQRLVLETRKAVAGDHSLAAGAEKFLAELAWRDFSYGLLAQRPLLHAVNFRRDFDGFPWRDDEAGFHAWCRGETGYDLVDAGMRELWQTGYMHNRVRMVTASFLVKHLLIDWRRGEQWFWDCLLDADPANNPASWQWVAGCGADAAPYFRVFNPITQAEKFDPQGEYRARYIQGYTDLSPSSLHMKSGNEGADSINRQRLYPQPIVDHAFARDRALAAYKNRGNDEDAGYGDTD